VIEAFEQEKARAKLPGYVPTYDDFDEEQVMVEVREDRTAAVEPARVQPAEKPRGPTAPLCLSRKPPITPQTTLGRGSSSEDLERGDAESRATALP